MKKMYFFMFTVVVLLLSAQPVKATITNATDLYGKYHFTATAAVTDYGKDYADYFSSDCEVTITRDENGIFDGKIVGLAGSTAEPQNFTAFSTETNTIRITNPNGGNGVWAGGLAMSNADGIYPWQGKYNNIKYTFDPETGVITLPDFTLVRVTSHADMTAEVVVKMTEAKLVMTEKETIDIDDLSGTYTYSANYTMDGSTLPTAWTMDLASTDDSKKAYNATLNIEGFSPVALTAIFDGVNLTFPIDNTALDVEKGLYLYDKDHNSRTGSFDMKYASGRLSLSQLYIVQHTDGLENDSTVQYYVNGNLTKQVPPTAFSWEGDFVLKAGAVTSYDEETYADEITIGIIRDSYDNGLYLTMWDGKDISALTYGGIPVKVSADGRTATITAGEMLGSIVPGSTYLYLVDQNGQTDDINFVLNEDDKTFTVDPFAIAIYDYSTYSVSSVKVFYQNIIGRSAVEPVHFDWVGQYTVTATVESLDGQTYDDNFMLTIAPYSASDPTLFVVEMMGGDTYSLNYGGFEVKLTADSLSGTMDISYMNFLKCLNRETFDYLAIYDIDGNQTSLALNVIDENSFSIADFLTATYSYMSYSVTGQNAKYTNVVATRYVPEPIHFDWAGQYTITATVESLDGQTYDDNFMLTIAPYSASDPTLFVVEMMGGDTYSLNYGGFEVKLASDSLSGTMDISYMNFLKCLNRETFDYLAIYDVDGNQTSLAINVIDENSFSIADFLTATYSYMSYSVTGQNAKYTNVVATKYVPEPIHFDWARCFTVTADVESLDGETYDTEFSLVIEPFSAAYPDLLIMEFLGGDTYSLNYGGIDMYFAEDSLTASIKTDVYVKTIVPGEAYWKLYDANGGSEKLAATVIDENTFTIADFMIGTAPYGGSLATKNAKYTNVVAAYDPVRTFVVPAVTDAEAVPATYYDMNGRQSKRLMPGLNIVRMSDGTVRKVLFR